MPGLTKGRASESTSNKQLKCAMHLIIGTGKVGLPLSQLFHASKVPAISTSRSGKVPSPLTGVAFDWTDPSTFENPFTHGEVIQSIFMTPPPSIDLLPPMKPFIDFAKNKGVKRFVILSASLLPSGDYAHGAVHKYLSEIGVEYAAIRPSWFFQNFLPSPNLYADDKNNVVISSTGSAKLGFVNARDIAEAAFHAMTSEEPLNGSYIVFGPQLLNYAEVAEILSSVTGQSITHRNLTRSEFKENALRIMPEPYAEAMASLEDAVRAGAEERYFNGEVTTDEHVWKGKRTIRSYFEEFKEDWGRY